ncbi:hypothetical protein [Nocardioides sp. GXZ039]|uniref:hypothetical protein n=1 Tax=Nocardioides sp. GXZ039 TaxID=3136018 RepID=UPI0030F44096
MKQDDIENYLERTSAQAHWAGSSEDDVRRGARALRRRRLATGGAAALAVGAIAGGLAVAQPWDGDGAGDGGTGFAGQPTASDSTAASPATPDAPESVTEPPPSPDPEPTAQANPYGPRIPGMSPKWGRPTEDLVLHTLDPDAEFAGYGSSYGSSWGTDGRLNEYGPEINWQAPGMKRPGFVEVRIIAVEDPSSSGWQCSSQCDTYNLDGREVNVGVTDAGDFAYRYVQADGEIIEIHAKEFPDGVELPRPRVNELLTSPDLNVPDVTR